MEEKSLRVYSDKKFFTKLTNTITKLLIPTKIGINGMLISIKRNNVLKAYENYINSENVEADKKDEVEKKYEDMFSLYLEAIDKHMMDNVYKKVKNDTATGFEREALSKYYMVIHLKDTEYLEYKYRKQIFLIQLDYDTVKELNKEKLTDRYEHFYASRMEALYKKLLKNYSIKLSDDLQPREKDEIYNKIFGTVEEYITDILPIKMKEEPDNKIYKEILSDYENFERFTVGKLDQNDVIEKNMILLGISRKLFTHSLPLVIAEQCYEKLLVDARTLIMDTKVIRKQEKAYGLLINIIDDYNLRLLSTKIYWDKPSDREEYKKFYAEYKKVNELREKSYMEYSKNKEILFLKRELKEVYKNYNRYFRIIKFYKRKLVALGAMKELKNSCTSEGCYKKVEAETQIDFFEIEENDEYKKIIQKVVQTCFETEKLMNTNLYLNVILTNPETIRATNKHYREIDKETDVLSFPMFQKEELDKLVEESQTKKEIVEDVLGDIMISIPRVIEQADEYGHSVERELAYMVVHGFYHVMGYDHIKEEDKAIMRPKEEYVLSKLNITR